MSASLTGESNNLYEDRVFEIAQAIEQVSADSPIVEFDLGLSVDQIEMIGRLEITKNENLYMSYSGERETLEIKLAGLIGNVSERNIDIAEPLAASLSKLIHDIYQAMNAENLWMAVSASDGFDKPYRWHTDIPYRYDAMSKHSGVALDFNDNQCFHKKEYFALFAPKGSCTAFYNLAHDFREEYVHYAGILDQTERYKKIHNMVNESKISMGKNDRGYLILNGMHFGALHSRPAYSSERLFIGFGEIDQQSLEYFVSQSKK